METTPIEAAQIITLIQQGFSQRTIARQLHLSQSCVTKVYKRFRETGNLVRRPGSGRQRCTSARDDRFIVSTSLRNRHLTGVDVQRELGEVRGRTVSEWTVRRRLKEANLTPKRPATEPKLSTAHRHARLQFARDYLDWDIQQWSRVLFADETRMCLHGSDRRRRVYRRPGERYAQCCIAETVAYGGYSVRWFRLRGNLLFYLKGPEPWYEPFGVIVLGNHQVSVQAQDENGHWPFQLAWENGACYRMATYLESERTLWLKAMASAPYETLTQRIADLQQQLNDTRTMIDLKKYRATNKIINDFNEVPLCELSLSCDNLLCDANGNPPSPFAAVFVLFIDKGMCVRYGCTEVVEKSSNPNFSRTIMFRGSDGINSDVMIRILLYDMRESVTQTGVAIGSVTMRLSHIQEAQRLRVPLLTVENRIVGFVTFNGWSLEAHSATSPTHPPNPEKNSIDMTPKLPAHRRSQSLPPRMGLKLQYPSYSMLIRQNFLNPHQATYRFHSGLGGDITVHEALAEPSFCFTMPLQLVNIFLTRETELLETMTAFAEVSKCVKPRHIDLVGNHLAVMRLKKGTKLAKDHVTTQTAVIAELQAAKDKMLSHSVYFKPSIRKVDKIAEEPELAYVPVNLHLQRMWVHNDTLNKRGFHDIITVGAFSAHTHTSDKPGGLIRLLQQSKDISTRKAEMTANTNRLDAEFEKLRAMKNLQNILVAHMDSALLLLHKGLFGDMKKSMTGIRNNVKLILDMWNVEATEEALTKVGWNKRRIDEDDAQTRRADQLALQARLNQPGGIAHRSACSAAAIATVAAMSVPSVRRAIINMTIEAVDGSNRVRTAKDVPKKATDPVDGKTAEKQNDAKSAAKPDSDTDTAKLTVTPFKTVNPVPAYAERAVLFKTRSEIDLWKTLERAFLNESPAASRSLSESDLRRISQHYDTKNQSLSNDRNKNGKNSEHGAEGKVASTSGVNAGEDSVPQEASGSELGAAGTSGNNDLEEDTNDSVFSVADTSGQITLEEDASTSGLSAAGTSGNIDLEPQPSTSGLSAAGTSGNIDLEPQPSTSGLSAAGTSGNIDLEPQPSTSGVSAPSGKGAKRPVAPSGVLTTNSQNTNRSYANGKSNRGKPRGSKNNRAPKLTKQARKEANKESLRLARGENAPAGETAQFGTVKLNVDFRSPTSFEQVTTDNTFVNKKGSKKNKRNRRETVIEQDPSIRDYNLNFFKELKNNLNKIMNKLFINLNIIVVKGNCTSSEFEECRIMMDLSVKLLDEVQNWTRMAHTAMRIATEPPAWTVEYNMLRSRRDICFSQALTAAAAGILSWATTTPADIVVKIVQSGLGPLLGFEGLLSMYAQERTMWGDMVIAVEDLHTLTFKIVPVTSSSPIIPQVTGSRSALVIEIPVTGAMYTKFENMATPPSFTVTAVFFNIGINDKASLAEALGDNKPQYQSNKDNFERLFKYYLKYCQQFPQDPFEQLRASSRSKPLEEVIENLRAAIQKRASKDVEVLHLAALATRLMHGIRFTSCKSAKDRTGMSVTLEQATILSNEYHLADHERKPALDIMRSEGCRRENTMKNIGQSKYAFTKQQVMALPEEYRPPQGSYGTGAT